MAKARYSSLIHRLYIIVRTRAGRLAGFFALFPPEKKHPRRGLLTYHSFPGLMHSTSGRARLGKELLEGRAPLGSDGETS